LRFPISIFFFNTSLECDRVERELNFLVRIIVYEFLDHLLMLNFWDFLNFLDLFRLFLLLFSTIFIFINPFK